MILGRILQRLFASRSDPQAHASVDAASAHGVLPPRGQPDPGKLFNFFAPVIWLSQDPQVVADSARRIVDASMSGHHFADNLLTWGRNMSMLDDPAFVRAWRDNIESQADEAILWRRYVLACAGYHCVQLGGDFVECGAYTGVGMKTVIDYLGGPAFPRGFWGYDIFEHDATMLNHSMPEHGSNLYERVRAKFAAYPQVRIVRGLIPQSFDGASPERIAYLHIDLNQAQAEIDALDALFHRVVPGGIVILDDYEWSGVYRSQKLAEDPWFDARQYRVMPLPTGQGLVIKR